MKFSDKLLSLVIALSMIIALSRNNTKSKRKD